jgi:choline dehydrogenase-like flavoprotein
MLGPYSGGHNTVAFLPADNFLPEPEYIIQPLTKQEIGEHLPDAYSGDRTLVAGYDAQRRLIADAFVKSNSSLIEVPIAGDAYILMVLQKPLSRGTITIDPANPMEDPPLVDFRTMSNPVDMDVMVAMIRFARKWARTKAMKLLTPVENLPGIQAKSDEQLRHHIRSIAESSIGHESGTCAMLPLELGGVVGPDLLVYGIKGLSVADASIIPLVPSTNLCATIYAIAEKVSYNYMIPQGVIWHKYPNTDPILGGGYHQTATFGEDGCTTIIKGMATIHLHPTSVCTQVNVCSRTK